MNWNPFSHLSETRAFASAKLIRSSFRYRVKDTFKVFYGELISDNFELPVQMGLLDYLLPWQKALAFLIWELGHKKNYFILSVIIGFLFIIPWLAIEGIKGIAAALLTLLSLPIIAIVHKYYSFKKEKLERRIEELYVKPCMDEESYRIKTVNGRIKATEVAEIEAKKVRLQNDPESCIKACEISRSAYRVLDTPEIETREEYLEEERHLGPYKNPIYRLSTPYRDSTEPWVALPLRKYVDGKYKKIDIPTVRLYLMAQDNELERKALEQNTGLFGAIVILVGTDPNRIAHFYHYKKLEKRDKVTLDSSKLSQEQYDQLTFEEAYSKEALDKIIKEEQGAIKITLSAEEQNYLATEQGWVKKNPQNLLYRSIIKKVENYANHPFCLHTSCDQIPDALGLYDRDSISYSTDLPEGKPAFIISVEPKNYSGIRAALKLNTFWSTKILENHLLIDFNQFTKQISKKKL